MLNKALKVIRFIGNKAEADVSTLDGTIRTVHLTKDQGIRLQRWADGEDTIQYLLPDLSPSERELFLTGMTDEDWNRATLPPEELED